MTAGFYPIIIWNLEGEEPGNPVEKIVEGLERILSGDISSSDSFTNTLQRVFAQQLLPPMNHILVPGPITLENGVLPPPDPKDPGRLLIRTFLPEKHYIRRIGGKGYRFWAGGKNRDSGNGYIKKYAVPGSRHPIEAGAWRIVSLRVGPPF